jgi:photosystem II stability/assembly factor-like uncharacterized protein
MKELEDKYNKNMLELMRSWYLGSFCPLNKLSAELQCDKAVLKNFLTAQPDIFGPPAAMKYQNKIVSTENLPTLALNSRSTKKLQNNCGDTPWEVTVSTGNDVLKLSFSCTEPAMIGLTERNQHYRPDEAETHYQYWRGDVDYFKTRLPELAKIDKINITDRGDTFLSGDSLIVFLTPVKKGQDNAQLDCSREAVMNKKFPVLTSSKIYFEGTFYLLAIAPDGQVLLTFYDSWDDGYFWPVTTYTPEVKVSHNADSWSAEVLLDLKVLEPMIEPGDIWGLDFFRNRLYSTGSSYSGLDETLFLQSIDTNLIFKNWQPTPEDRHRHEWVGSRYPHDYEKVPDVRLDYNALNTATIEATLPLQINGLFNDRTGKDAEFKTEIKMDYSETSVSFEFTCFDPDISDLQTVAKKQEEELFAGTRLVNYLNRRMGMCRGYLSQGISFDQIAEQQNLPGPAADGYYQGLGWGDYVELNLSLQQNEFDSQHAGKFILLINSTGDTLSRYYDPNGFFDVNASWEHHADIAVNKNSDNWQVTVTIPYTSFSPITGNINGLFANFSRMRAFHHHDYRREYSSWLPKWSQYIADYAGKITFAKPVKVLTNPTEINYINGYFEEDNLIPETKDRSADTITSTCFVDENLGWAVGGRGSLFKTTNGGLDWRTVDINSEFLLENVAFKDANSGIIVGGWQRSDKNTICGGMGIILVTADGGKTWNKVKMGDIPWLNDLIFSNANTVFAVGEKGAVLKSEDAGLTWQHLRNTQTSAQLNAISITGAAKIIAVGAKETIIISENAGSSWQKIQVDIQKPTVFPVEFHAVTTGLNQQLWIAGSHGTLLKSLADYHHWQQVSGLVSAETTNYCHFNNIQFNDSGHGILTLEHGRTYFVTDDGGSTWQPSTVKLPERIKFLSVKNSKFYAGGFSGFIATLDPGGSSYNMLKKPVRKTRWLFITPHPHHLNSLAGIIAAMADDVEWGCLFISSTANSGKVALAAAESIGAHHVYEISDICGGRRRMSGRNHHHYQLNQGLESSAAKVCAVFRDFQPDNILTEWPIMDEGYWAGEPGYWARSCITAYNCCNNPNKYQFLAELGLEPFNPANLWINSDWFNDFFNINRTSDNINVKNKFQQTLGKSPAQAESESKRAWEGMLDRGKVKPITLANVQEYNLNLCRYT